MRRLPPVALPARRRGPGRRAATDVAAMTNATAIGTLEQALAHAERLLGSDPALAGEQAAEILKVATNHPAALRLLAAARLGQGDTQGALEILEPLARSQPNWALAQLDLGLALGHDGRGQQAIDALRRAVALKPDLPQAWRALGDHLMAAGEQEAADAAYANHVRHSTSDPQLLAAILTPATVELLAVDAAVAIVRRERGGHRGCQPVGHGQQIEQGHGVIAGFERGLGRSGGWRGGAGDAGL